MAGRKWTDEELAYLEEKADSMSTHAIARNLHRSYNSVNIKASREGIILFNNSTDMISTHALATMMNVEERTVMRWHRLGLKFKNINGRKMHHQKVLITFLKEHQDLWDATRCDPYLISMCPWFKEKYESDMENKKQAPNHLKNWSSTDMQTLVYLRDKGWSFSKLAERYGHTENACKQKYYSLKRGEKSEKVGRISEHG